MKCPACRNELQAFTVEGLTVDVCKTGCGGIWFDNFELKKVDEAQESLGQILLDEAWKSPGAAPVKSEKRPCPKCAGAVMRSFYFTVRKEVQIDECPNCAGVWLDVGELALIRRDAATEAQRAEEAKREFAELFDTHLAVQAAESAKDRERKEKFARAFRWITPSYWIPGKQRGGAF